MIARLLEKEAYPKAWASNFMIRAYYEKHPHQFFTPERIRVLHILIKSPPDQDETLRARAFETIHSVEEKLAQGDDFAALAIDYSQCPSSILGGDLGYFSRDEIIPEISNEAFALNPGQISSIFQSRLGYHLVKCVDRKVPRKITFQMAKENLAKTLRFRREKKLSADYVKRLKKGAQIDRLLP
jgi:parvulin-like peptidyl-prolyl isomerase